MKLTLRKDFKTSIFGVKIDVYASLYRGRYKNISLFVGFDKWRFRVAVSLWYAGITLSIGNY
jgi:hypothetical protein